MATPLTASELLRVLKGEGLTIKTPHVNWTTHERDEATGKPFGPVHGVVMHHTAGLDVYDYVYNGSSDLPGPLCHGYIDKAGTVWMCSAGRANHAGGGDPAVLTAVINESYGTTPPAPQYHEGSAGAADGNDPFYGFECENLGTGKDPWPEEQYNAMVKAASAICRFYGWSAKSVIGHLEWSNWKSDPAGFTMAQFREDVKDCLAAAPGTWPQEEPVALQLDDATITAIAKKVLQLDGVIANPDPTTATDNPYISLQTSVRNIEIVVRRIEAAVAALAAK